jgi:hypothetical protein
MLTVCSPLSMWCRTSALSLKTGTTCANLGWYLCLPILVYHTTTLGTTTKCREQLSQEYAHARFLNLRIQQSRFLNLRTQQVDFAAPHFRKSSHALRRVPVDNNQTSRPRLPIVAHRAPPVVAQVGIRPKVQVRAR